MKKMFLALLVLLTPLPAVALDFSHQRESTNVDVATPLSASTVVINSVDDLKKAGATKLSKLNDAKAGGFIAKVNANPARRTEEVPCKDIYFAQWADGSFMLMQVDANDKVIHGSEIVGASADLTDVMVQLPDVFTNLEDVESI